jgi:DNA modification methylase
MNYLLLCGDSLEKLKDLDDCSVDSIVTDPPYELGFMGKKWDSTGIAFNVELWKEALRVLKPGGHLIAFSGSRTYHRMAVAIEDAGFEIRDQVLWMYGSGFPKSLDVSKAIDKTNGRVGDKEKFTEWMRTTGLKASELNKITNTFMGSHYLTAKEQPAVPTLELWELIKLHIKVEIPDYINEIVNRVEAEREVIGKKTTGIANKEEKDRHTIGSSKAIEVDITAPSTPQAKQWQGFGTALKPAHEPMVLARKPMSEKTVAENVLKWGVGALNIDGCRVGSSEDIPKRRADKEKYENTIEHNYGSISKRTEFNPTQGRFPANIIHDGSEEVESVFPNTKSTTPTEKNKRGGKFPDDNTIELGLKEIQRTGFDDSGSASRYFYCAKASKKDRNEGLDSFELKAISSDKGNGLGRVCDKCGTSQLTPCDCEDNTWILPAKNQNNHPTVKPTDLMAYLVRLVTPPNGTVLDPFNGSGSTGKACAREGFDYIGIDLSQEYLDISKARIEFEIEKKNGTESKKQE